MSYLKIIIKSSIALRLLTQSPIDPEMGALPSADNPDLGIWSSATRALVNVLHVYSSFNFLWICHCNGIPSKK